MKGKLLYVDYVGTNLWSSLFSVVELKEIDKKIRCL